jgi:hypothetical protein
MILQLDLPPKGLAHRLGGASRRATQETFPQGAGGTSLAGGAEERYRPVPFIPRHVPIGRGHAGWASHTALSVIGRQVDRKLVLADVLLICF